ncbi:hypothetical protein ACIPRL_21905 [Streptomyces sp. NPDC090085]|uniref:hypothetical protein n=1 Tax=Streptomyces sp. NPDC090085 TaxID=3365943 RepID=UPI00380886C9
MTVVMYTDFVDAEEPSSLDDLETAIVEGLNEWMGSVRRTSQFLPPPPQGGTATEVALRTLRMLQDAKVRMRERGAYVRYPCNKCSTAECRTGKANLDAEERDAQHSSVNFIAMVLIRLAEAIRMVQALPATREALIAALIARNAAIEGDSVTVDAFSRDWLGLADAEGWRTAVENALLGEWVHHLGSGMLHDPTLRNLLYRHTCIEHKHLQPLWERRVSGRRLRLLHDPVGDGLELADVAIDHRRPEDALLLGELEDSRLITVLRGLTPQEVEVATAWASDPGATWAEAAAMLRHGDPEAFGERVRRKLKRLGARQTERAAAARVA